jgi:hypothetical protein
MKFGWMILIIKESACGGSDLWDGVLFDGEEGSGGDSLEGLWREFITPGFIHLMSIGGASLPLFNSMPNPDESLSHFSVFFTFILILLYPSTPVLSSYSSLSSLQHSPNKSLPQHSLTASTTSRPISHNTNPTESRIKIPTIAPPALIFASTLSCSRATNKTNIPKHPPTNKASKRQQTII